MKNVYSFETIVVIITLSSNEKNNMIVQARFVYNGITVFFYLFLFTFVIFLPLVIGFACTTSHEIYIFLLHDIAGQRTVKPIYSGIYNPLLVMFF
jgi:hypothetical protein